MSSSAPLASTPKRDVQWADGIRGIACLLVVIAHTFESFYWPQHAFDRPYHWMTLPYLRLSVQGGYMSVAIFFILSGYVCSIKPLKLARAGKAEEARKNIASSAFRRVFRLGGPSIFVTTVSWLFDRFGAFDVALSLPPRCWLYVFSPLSMDFASSVRALFRSFVTTWNYDGPPFLGVRNAYEGIQWTMAHELRGSMMIYLALTVTASFTPINRCLVLFGLIAYATWVDIDVLGLVPFYTGALLADMSIVLNSNCSAISSFGNLFCTGRLRLIKTYWPIALSIVALYFASYPPSDHEFATWSENLHQFGLTIFPDSWQFEWAFPFLGALILIFAIHFSPTLRRIFSHPFAVFLGSISFPLYLIHSFLMRSFLTRIIYQWIPDSGGFVTRQSDYWDEPVAKSPFWTAITVFIFPLWLVFVTFLSVLWRDKLDGHFIRLSSWAEEIALGKVSVAGLSGLIETRQWLKAGSANGHMRNDNACEKAQVLA